MNRYKRPLRYKMQDALSDGFIIVLFLFAGIFERIATFLVMIFKMPMRAICKAKGDHTWRHFGGGFSPFPGPKYPFVCQVCGTRSNGTMDDLAKKGFKGRAKI